MKNIVLMGIPQNLSDILHFQNVDEPLLLAKQVLDRDYDGILLLSEVASRLNGSSPDAAKKKLEFSGRKG